MNAVIRSLSEQSTSRRLFLQGSGGLLLGFALPGFGAEQPRNEKPSEAVVGQATSAMTQESAGLAPNAFIRIDRAGVVTLIIHKVEMGQGTFTSLPMLLAEELAVDLDRVKLEQAPADNARYADPLLGGQVTGGSTSIRATWTPLRQAGATARTLLISAAAQQWKVDPSTCVARNGVVTHQASNRTLNYGELVDAAAQLPVPKEVTLKQPKDFTLIGKAHQRLDSPEKINGQARFGIDVRLPNMSVAAIAISPVLGGKLQAGDENQAMAVKGVRQVIKLDHAVAVLADHMWAAKQGLAALSPTWNEGANATLTTQTLVAGLRAASEKPGAVARNDGQADKAIGAATRKVEAIYEMPYLAHATMEPVNCTVDLRDGLCELWVGTQVPALAQGVAAKITGYPLNKVRVHNHYLGGGFGRRLETDFIALAVEIAKQARGPVKVVYSREDDIQHDMYRPYYLDRMSAGLDDKSLPVGWFHRITGSSILARFAPAAVQNGIDSDAVEGAKDQPYAIPNVRVEYVRHESPVPTAFWRGVGATHNIWVVESFIDELAAAAKQDPLAYRQGLLKNQPRMRSVLELAANKAGWSKPLSAIEGRRMGRGLSVQFAFGSYMSQVAEISVGADGEVQVHRVVCAVDCGHIVNPDTVIAQIESGVVFGLSAALWNEVTFDKGRVQQNNFTDYRVMRINEAPTIEVHLVKSNDAPGGIGEPGTSAIAPALTNAIFAATGTRLRKLPVTATSLKA
ncbi:xanthine dehydrogenase family protein molybdopterin-binding subunit [Steroidobacter cummioxidans]|uniref:xanthine dehydrogenase family protein molybdopterin-binding subunit n=1 Tax=Steroidobacter cummioxidans TaxID=1803913 RepID=UPI000E30E239|nr:xanthine dehydrogenase family protein molybdopterin-binding subunit [Steroidobacter cummioxidans]